MAHLDERIRAGCLGRPIDAEILRPERVREQLRERPFRPLAVRTCRQPPHGGVGSPSSVDTATASIRRSPAMTAAATAFRSAHTLSGYDAFSMFAPT
jgi:hypothetical protein